MFLMQCNELKASYCVILIVKYSWEGQDFWGETGQSHYLNEWRDFLWLKLVTFHAKLVLC